MKSEKSYTETSEYNYQGSAPEGKPQVREIKKSPSPRVELARELYFETKSSASVEFPYWYSRKWDALEGEIPIVRRAESLRSGFEHLTPAIFPGELLVMGKTPYLRGSYPMPWLSEAFFMAQEDEMYKEAKKAGKVSADEATTMGQGGGNVTKSAGNVLSLAGKFGLRKEEMPILIHIAKNGSISPLTMWAINMNNLSLDTKKKKRSCVPLFACSIRVIHYRRAEKL